MVKIQHKTWAANSREWTPVWGAISILRSIVVLAVTFLTLGLPGCGDSPAPVRPLNGPTLSLSVPDPTYGNAKAKFTLILTLKYRISNGAEVVEGSLDYSQLPSIAGPVNIQLPHGGLWLASAEWINLGTGPLFIGADLVDVEGPTLFDLKMGTLNSTCYKDTLADVITYTPDLLTFDSNFSDLSLNGPSGDVQCVFDNTALSLKFQKGTIGTSATQFAYLGNGDWVDFTAIPPTTVFHPDSLIAKRAVAGLSAVMAAGDVYVARISAADTAWLQIDQVTNSSVGSASFYFRLNRHGDHYLKFDVTSFGDANCNTSGVTLY